VNFPFYIARRYLLTASKNNAINIINAIASLSVIVGAAALFIFLSVFSGLKDFSLSFSNDFDPDLKVIPEMGKTFLVSKSQEQQLRAIEGVVMASKVTEERVLFVFEGKEQVAYLKGVDSLFGQVNDVNKTLLQGQWLAPNSVQVVIGNGIAEKLSVGLLDYNNPFEVYVPKPGKGDIEGADDAFRKAELTPAGIYAITEDLDSKYVFADLGFSQVLLNYKPEEVSAIEIKIEPGANSGAISEKINALFKAVTVKTRAQLNDSLYRMLNTENLAVYLIFTLVLIVALFNLVGALYMMILDKKSNLKTLSELGAETRHLRFIFLFQGTLLSFFGGVIGLLVGIAVILLQQHFRLVMITPSQPYPVAFTFTNLAIVFVTIISLGFVASLVASLRVGKKLLE
jgi:lipoprotein-releasing system permease protein